MMRIKKFIAKQTNVDVYRYRHGEVVGTKTIKYFGLFSRLKPFDNFTVKNGVVTIYNTVDVNTRYTIHDNCE